MLEYITSGFTGSLYSYALVYWFGSFMVYLAAIGREEKIMCELINIRGLLHEQHDVINKITSYDILEIKAEQQRMMKMVKNINHYYY